MATTSKIDHNNKRKHLVELTKKRRLELRGKSKDLKLPLEERMEARRKLTKMKRNSSEIRIRNRCELTGRPRAYLRKFGLCRIKFRELALRGEIPGVVKSSW